MRDWLNSILGQDGGRVAQFALALIAVVLLILLLAWVIRRLQPGTRLVAATGGKVRKRLGVLEASDVDARRRLVLVRRDDVEHLIMIGGPNDLLIESRILRGGHAAARPNVQQMPRPAPVTDGERYAPPLVGPAPTGPTPIAAPSTGPVMPPQVVSSQLTAPQAPASSPSRDVPDEEPELPLAAVPAPNPAPTFVPPPFVPPNRVTTGLAAATPPSPTTPVEPRRPSLSDLLTAATAAKASDPRDLPQPMMAPPPMPRMKAPQPDLEEDDRDMPTQIVSQRTPQPVTAPAPIAPVIEPPASRETEVATQIERALADLNPLMAPVETPARVEPKVEATPQSQMPSPRRPQMEPVQAPTTAPITRPVPVASTPTMPPVPPRPTPPAARPMMPERPIAPERPTLAERPPLVDRPAPPERSALPERIEPQVRSVPAQEARTDDRAPTGQSAAFVPEPVTAPRPITAPVPRPPVAAVNEPVEPVQAPAPVSPAKQKTDELEEEMAKLLSELGGSSSR